jgi:hypothetical protein
MGETKLDVIRDHTEKHLADFKEHPLTTYLGPSGVTTVKLIERMASHEGRPNDVPGLLDDMLQCYVKHNYPHFDLSYQDETPPGLKEHREMEAKKAEAALPPPPAVGEIAASAAAPAVGEKKGLFARLLPKKGKKKAKKAE